jgi:hypothetical protein
VAKPASTNQTCAGGTISALNPPWAPAGTYAYPGTNNYVGNTYDVHFCVGLTYNKGGSNLQGQITLTVPQQDGSLVYIKSNSISSMAVTGLPNYPRTSTIYTKASLYKVQINGSMVSIDGNASLRVDAIDNGTMDSIGFTVLSSKNSTLHYSNNWVLSGSGSTAVWKTVVEALKTGFIDVK